MHHLAFLIVIIIATHSFSLSLSLSLSLSFSLIQRYHHLRLAPTMKSFLAVHRIEEVTARVPFSMMLLLDAAQRKTLPRT